MTPIEKQLAELREKHPSAFTTVANSGATLVSIPEVNLPPGWSMSSVTVLFVAPPGFPNAQPDCFWVEPVGLRLGDGGTPQATNDSNPIPEFAEHKATWFSWHLQQWDPIHDSLFTYLKVVMQRLIPPR